MGLTKITSRILDSSGVTILGTIATGVWAATDIAVLHGGTGASTAGAARTNLGLVIGTHVLAQRTFNDSNWDNAYTDRLKWDGGATGLNQSTGRTSLGLGTVATTAASDYATSAQGTKADSAQQPPSEGAFANGDKTKLDAIEASADVTDTTNVTSAGALMDSEVTNLTQVKAFDSTDYVKTTTDQTIAGNKTFSGDILIDSALPRLEMKLNGSTAGYVTISGGNNQIVTGSVSGDMAFRVVNKSYLFSVNNGSSSALTILSSGASTFSGKVKVSDGGNTTVPSFRVGSDTNGLSSPSTNQLNFITNSLTRLSISSGGTTAFARPNTTANVAMVTIRSTDSQGANVGGTLGLGGSYGAGLVNYALIRGAKETGTYNDSNGYMSFTVHSSAGQVERMRIQSDGDIKITGGGRILSSGGIYLGTNNNVNLLDVYEEDTYSPTLKGASTAGSSPTGVGTYTVIGNVCHLNIRFSGVNVSGAAGAITINLPFAGKSGVNGQTTSNFNTYNVSFTGTYKNSLYVSGGNLYGLSSVTSTTWADWAIVNASNIYWNLSVTYLIN